MAKNNEIKNLKELSGHQVFERAKAELIPIQENLSEKKMTINEARSELKKINEWIQGTKLDQEDKEEVGRVFERLAGLEKDIDSNTLKDEVDDIINLLEKITQGDLANLKQVIQKNGWQGGSERPFEVRQKITESLGNFASTVNNAIQDKNPIARKVGERMEKLMS